MAGIGFEIRKLLSRGTALDVLLAYGHAAIVSCGPWIISILTLAGLSWIVPPGIGEGDLALFRTLIIYAYAFSLVVTGFFLMPFTRHLADSLYLKDAAAIVPSFFSSTLIVAGALGVVAAFALPALPLSVPVRIFSGSIFMFVGLIWHAMAFVSASQDFRSVVRAFVLGSILGLGSAWMLGRCAGLAGYLAGFAIGQAGLWMLLVRGVIREYPSNRLLESSVTHCLRRFPALAGAGFLYSLGIWIDKIVFWYLGPGKPVSGFLRSFPPYDSAMFLAYLTTLPAFSIFLVRVETDFYERYRRFYQAIEQRSPLSVLEARQLELGEAMNRGLWSILKWQGSATMLSLLFADFLAEAMGLDPAALGIFRIGTLGAFLHVLFLVTLIFVLYFDCRRTALGLTAVFCTLCGLLTLATIRMGYASYGYGYFLACLASFVLAYGTLVRIFRRLIFMTFSGQPISPPGAEEEN